MYSQHTARVRSISTRDADDRTRLPPLLHDSYQPPSRSPLDTIYRKHRRKLLLLGGGLCLCAMAYRHHDSFIDTLHLTTQTPQQRPVTIAFADVDHLNKLAALCAGVCSSRTLDAPSDDEAVDLDALDTELLSQWGSDGLGPFSNAYTDGSDPFVPFQRRDTDQFALGRILTHRFSRYVGLVNDTDQADFVFLPLLTREFAHCRPCEDRQGIAWDGKSIGHEITDRYVELLQTFKSRRAYPSIIVPLSLIRRDYEGNLLKKSVSKVFDKDLLPIGIEREPWYPPEIIPHFIMAPYPSFWHLRHSAELIKQSSSERRKRHKRNDAILISFNGKIVPNSPNSGKGPYNGFALRQALNDQLEAARIAGVEGVSMLVSTPSGFSSGFDSIFEEMQHSTFCLEPPGDSSTRKGFYDAILMGCIPVIFRPHTYIEVSTPQGPVTETSLYVPEDQVVDGSLDIVSHLRAIPARVISEKRDAMDRHRPHVQYSLDATDSQDAFAQIVTHMSKIAMS
ncbi:glycosyltransferase family 47 protein [Mixia osmundae IAM 14324]|uniref:Exostosin GT47 domain-containing protein n=1 Tax=Mixia osmundae (strain CBS 9802 / IAM 14324 / JCM 22182 / KY 12970) TaxID=764103 RepID=G7DYW1_MIXOS|nr:glycosyltransferase family 47 protein [Mixia osmundae IAM 14324]KEI41667.1 glycosyltransferase family 47 protein [Mixia osmundae IAM 14324]GAA95771.1 hypothetical protein E5Q_02428 [Mixia osmundae IAM 14324]